MYSQKNRNHLGMTYTLWIFLTVFLFLMRSGSAFSQEASNQALIKKLEGLEQRFENLGHSMDVLQKAIDDVLWYHKVGDIAYVDKIRHVGPPPAHVKNPTGKGVKNPVKFYSYVFIPKNADRTQKYPLLVFPHG